MEGSIKCSANYAPLTPISFLERSGIVYGDRVSIVYGETHYTWSQTLRRCKCLASALSQLGISLGHVVGVLAPNIPAMYELHFGVPMAGAVLCTFNTRHDAAMLSVLLRHSKARVLFADHQLFPVARAALRLLSDQSPPLLVLIQDQHSSSEECDYQGLEEYEELISRGSAEFEAVRPRDELDAISVNYTSGTTSSPKGVMYSHRGAYLNSLAVLLHNDVPSNPVYLWCVPMFHCNGWCFTWALAAHGGTSVCLRHVTPRAVFSAVRRHGVTHMGGAPTVLSMLLEAEPGPPLSPPVSVMTGAAPPPPTVLFRMRELGFNVVHSYGLTEVYGPATFCAWKPQWDSLHPQAQARLKARQGVAYLGVEVDVKDPETMESVAGDGKAVGEVMFRGNTVMSGYLRDEAGTREAFRGGWFRSGDVAVKHADGYLEVKDRSKDIIITGGENVSSIEVEAALYAHPAVAEAAVVARPHPFWGETPCAFLKLKDGCTATEADIIAFVRARLPHYMAPRTVVFQDCLPKTSTGKIQKFALRDTARAMGALPTSKL